MGQYDEEERGEEEELCNWIKRCVCCRQVPKEKK